jgi:hypothetical protein
MAERNFTVREKSGWNPIVNIPIEKRRVPPDWVDTSDKSPGGSFANWLESIDAREQDAPYPVGDTPPRQ